jgi:glycosyltransferase involved in cell wall biosynthesis
VNASGLKCYSLSPGCGYGDATSQYLVGLQDLSIAVNWQPIGNFLGENQPRRNYLRNLQPELSPKLTALLHRDISYDTVLISLPPTDWYREILEFEQGKKLFGYFTWELERLPEAWVPVLNRLSGLMVPSRFNQLACRRSGVTVDIAVIPHLARRFHPAPKSPQWMSQYDNCYMFYTIGTWTTRKAIESTVRAFLDRFTAEDDVCLVIKTDAIDYIAQNASTSTSICTTRETCAFTLATLLSDYTNPARIHLLGTRVTTDIIDALHERGDCFVSMARSEGWGLASFDALQSGNPVIMPGFGGHIDYLHEDYPLLVDSQQVVLGNSPNERMFKDQQQQKWSEASTSHAGELMARVAADPEAARLIAHARRNEILERFTADTVCRQMADFMGMHI